MIPSNAQPHSYLPLHHQQGTTTIQPHSGALFQQHPLPMAQNPGDTSPLAQAARRHDVDSIGHPVHFDLGPHAGKTVRAVLEPVQHAELGRKCADPPRAAGTGAGAGQTHTVDGADAKQKSARKDRRPLDPPPVVKLRLFEVIADGNEGGTEREIPTDSISIDGLICFAELFQYLDAGAQQVAAAYASTPAPSRSPLSARRKRHSPASSASHMSSPPPAHSPTGAEQHYVRQSPAYHPYAITTPTSSLREPAYIPGAPADATSPPGVYPPAVVATGAPNFENNLTSALFGTTYVHAASILDLTGDRAIFFVFSDLAVKLEGRFVLRFRFFDIHSPKMDAQDPRTFMAPVLAQCTGAPFCVYSTKEFPGLKASTELTKHLSRWGIRVNIRETERKRKRGARQVGGGGGGGGAAGAGASGSGAGARAARRRVSDDDMDSESDGVY